MTPTIANNSMFKDTGVAFLKSHVSAEICDSFVEKYQQSIKTNDAEFLRAKSVKKEKHIFSKYGHVVNPLLNIHFPDYPTHFSSAFLDLVKTTGLKDEVTSLVNKDLVMIQSMYFESNKGTEKHFDGEFVDSTSRGEMYGCWLALEDISEEAGRFYYYPGSCNLDNPEIVGGEVATLFKQYKAISKRKMENFGDLNRMQLLSLFKRSSEVLMECLEKANIKQEVPACKKGDVILFNSKTLHGAFRPKFNGNSRNSVSMHFIPSDTKIIKHNKTVTNLSLAENGGLTYHKELI